MEICSFESLEFFDHALIFYPHRDPRILASQLAQKAQRRRDRGCMRPDDITVIVVDVNPLNFITVGGKLGGSGAMGGDSGKDKCIMS